MPYWDTGQNTLAGARLKMLADDRKLKAVGNLAAGGRKVVHDYRNGGLMGVVDPKGEEERRNAEIERAELEERLGKQQDEAEAATDSVPGADEYELSADPRDWLSTLADVGGAVVAGPGQEHQRSLVELARFRGRLKAKEDQLSRARALSSTIAGSTDPGAVLEKVAPDLGFKAGGITMDQSDSDPNNDWEVATEAARQRFGTPHPTMDQIRDMKLELQNDELRLKQRYDTTKPERPYEWQEKKAEAIAVLTARNKGVPPTPEELWTFMHEKPMSEYEKRMLELFPSPAGAGQGPAARPAGQPRTPEEEDDELLHGSP